MPGAQMTLDQKNQDIDAGLSQKKKPSYFRKEEPASLLERDSGLPGGSTFIDNDGITVRRPFAV